MHLLNKFLKNDLGVAAIIFAFSIPMIIGSAGVGVDIAKAYYTKNKLEKTLDSAALAAASTTKTGSDLETFVTNYVKNNFAENDYSKIDLSKLTVKHDPDTKTITIDGEAESINTFMGYFSNPSVTVAAQSVSRKKLTGVEVALVLDNSESMKFDNKITDLKSAANDFVDTLYTSAKTTGGQFKIGIVPYGSFVNVGPYGLGKDETGKSYDVDGFVKNPDGLTYTKSRASGNPNWSGCVLEENLYNGSSHIPDWTMYKNCHDKNGNRINTGSGSRCNLTENKLKTAGYKNNCKVTGTKPCTSNVDGVIIHKTCNVYSCTKTCLTASCKHEYTSVPKNINIHDYCTNAIIQPLLLNSEPSSKGKLTSSIATLNAEKNAKTQSDIGMAWAYHLLSPEFPFSEGEKWDSPIWKKVIVFMTDGKIESDEFGPYYTLESNGSKRTTRAQEIFTQMCDKSKAKGTLIYTVQFGSIGDEALLTDCASDKTKALKASNGTELRKTFTDIAEDLGNIYLAK